MRNSIILFALVTLLALVLSACSNGVNTQDTTGVVKTNTQKTTTVVGSGPDTVPNPDVSSDINTSDMDNVTGDLTAIEQY